MSEKDNNKKRKQQKQTNVCWMDDDTHNNYQVTVSSVRTDLEPAAVKSPHISLVGWAAEAGDSKPGDEKSKREAEGNEVKRSS